MTRPLPASEPRETAVCQTSIEWNTRSRRWRGECTCGWVGERRWINQIKQQAAGHVRIERKSTRHEIKR